MASSWLGLGGLTAAGLAVWLAYELTWIPVVPGLPDVPVDATPAELPRLASAAPVLASLRTTLERPLFDDDRRPDPLADSTGAKLDQSEAAKALPARLTAVVVGADGRRSALIELTGQDQPVLVGKGEQVGGWRLEEIEDEAVVLSTGGQRTVVPLRIYEQPPARRPPAPTGTARRSGAERRPPPRAPSGDAEAPRADGHSATQPPTGTKAPAAERNPTNKRN